METEVPTVRPEMKVSELLDRISRGDPLLSRRQAIPIVDSDHMLVGIITRGDLVRTLADDPEGEEMVGEAGSRIPIVAYPDETVHEAVQRMHNHDIGRLLVISREGENRLLGYLGRSKIMEAWRRASE